MINFECGIEVFAMFMPPFDPLLEIQQAAPGTHFINSNSTLKIQNSVYSSPSVLYSKPNNRTFGEQPC
jgi:hypothetical protein